MDLHGKYNLYYISSPMWDMYVKKDLLCRNADGSLVKGDVWWNRQSYFVNMVNEWNAGVTKQRIDAFIEQVPLVKETGVLYFDNETQYPPSLYHYVTKEDQISAFRHNKSFFTYISHIGESI